MNDKSTIWQSMMEGIEDPRGDDVLELKDRMAKLEQRVRNLEASGDDARIIPPASDS